MICFRPDAKVISANSIPNGLLSSSSTNQHKVTLFQSKQQFLMSKQAREREREREREGERDRDRDRDRDRV